MSKILSAVLALTLLLTSTALAYPPMPGGDKQKEAPRSIETRVYIRNQCILSAPDANQKELFGALAGIFVPLLIKKALGGVSSALKKAGSPETLRDSGRLPTYLYQLKETTTPVQGVPTHDKKISLNPDLGCVIVVRGTFDSTGPAQPAAVTFPVNDSEVLTQTGDDVKRIARLRVNGILVSRIDVAFEAAIKTSDDLTALYYDGRFLKVNSFQGSRSSKSGRALVVSLAINAPAAKEGEGAISLSLMNMGDVKIDEVRGPEQLRSVRTGWLSGVGLTAEAIKEIETIKVADNQTVGIMPVTIEATLVETEAGNAALRFIADVLDSSKDDLTKTLSDEILKDRDKAAEDKATKAADELEKLRQAEEEAYANYLDAEATLTALPTPTTPAETDARKVKEFARDRTKRLWCAKFQALQTMRQAPAGRSCP
jgi:hypothetical protein